MADKTEAQSDSSSNSNRNNSNDNECSSSCDCDKTEKDSKIAQVNLEECDKELEPVSSSDQIRPKKTNEESKNKDEDDLVSSSSLSLAKTKNKKTSKTKHNHSHNESNQGRQGPPATPGKQIDNDYDDCGDAKVSNSITICSSSSSRQSRTPLKSKYPGPDRSGNAQEDEYKHEKERILSMKIDEKRKLYKCSNDFKTLDQIKTWPAYYAENKFYLEMKVKVNRDQHFPVNEDLNSKISVVRDDITCLEIDAIVNAANESLLGGGGVDGAIHSAAGKFLVKECATLGGCKVGEARITGGYKLPAKYVIHTVGPRGENPKLLMECYSNSLNHMKEKKLRSIAFPCISTGIFGYPNLNAANVALETIRHWLEEGDNSKSVDRIILCLFLSKDVDIYDQRLQVYFPVCESKSPAVETEPTEEPSDDNNKETAV